MVNVGSALVSKDQKIRKSKHYIIHNNLQDLPKVQNPNNIYSILLVYQSCTQTIAMYWTQTTQLVASGRRWWWIHVGTHLYYSQLATWTSCGTNCATLCGTHGLFLLTLKATLAKSEVFFFLKNQIVMIFLHHVEIFLNLEQSSFIILSS